MVEYLKQIPVERLRETLRYDPETGHLYWLERAEGPRTWNTKNAGKRAFTGRTAAGYHAGSIDTVKLYAHRVIWALVTGKWPESTVDHINGDRADNRFENFRAATRAENNRNNSGRKKRQAKFKGVSRDRTGGWRARIRSHGQEILLGVFRCQTAAALAYDRAAALHHREFARPNSEIGGRDARAV